MKQKIKEWYNCGVWTKQMVKNAVTKGVITKEEYEEIVGEPFSGIVSNGFNLDKQF